jgi:hypothetical protein
MASRKRANHIFRIATIYPSVNLQPLIKLQSQVMKSTERHFFHYTERTYHCIIMHIFKKQKQKQGTIKLNKQSINLT